MSALATLAASLSRSRGDSGGVILYLDIIKDVSISDFHIRLYGSLSVSRVAWIFPAPVIGDHLLAVPPVAGLEGVHRVAELLEHDVRVQTVGGGPAGEIATPQHRVEASRRGPEQLGGHFVSFDCQVGGQRSL